MSVTTNLYPPIIDTYTPAAIRDELLKVYFSISDFNSTEDMQEFAQVTVTDQESNISVLDKGKYPSEIMLKEIHFDDSREANQYYIEISAQDGIFDIDKFYKVQIRFTSTEASSVPIDWENPAVSQAIDDWLSANLDYFSEWSRVTLIKWIAANNISINGTVIETGVTITLPISDLNLIGKLIFDETSKEYLNRYRLIITDRTHTENVVDSGYLYTDKNSNDVNEFWYQLKRRLDPENSYTITIEYQTNSLYEATATAGLIMDGNSGEDQDFSFNVKENREEGDVLIHVSRAGNQAFSGSVTILRASDKDNFANWESLYTKKLENVVSNSWDWADTTVESGVLYKYALLETYNVTIEGEQTTVNYIKENSKILMLVFDDMFLTVANQQLKIQFNPQVSSFKRIINEGKVETIGSPYPYIRRNAAINYAQFPISGLISCQMDENENFITKEDLYGGIENLRKYEKYNSMDYNEPFMTTVDNDFVYEKKFRDAVIQYLMDGNVKLFRSTTEGNYLVRLTDVSFTPNQQLGRMIWSFSATANEIADNTVENCYKYGILK